MRIAQDHAETILIIEDNPDIAANIGDYLEGQGYIVDFAWDGISGMHLVLTGDFSAIVLDIMLPGMDGLTLCNNLRNADPPVRTPILMLTARDTLEDKLQGFRAGTDDYMVKPFALEELHVRLKALIARNRRSRDRVFHVGDLVLNRSSVEVTREGIKIPLNRTCLIILECLMESYPNVVTRQDLERVIWKDEPPDSDALRSHIYALRSRIDKPFSHPMIHTVHGIGLQLRLPDENQT